MTDDELQAIEARCDRAWKANAANDRMTWGIFWAAAEDVPALLAEVRRLGMENAALRELDVSRAELGHQNERLRESLAAMTNERNQWRAEAALTNRELGQAWDRAKDEQP